MTLFHDDIYERYKKLDRPTGEPTCDADPTCSKPKVVDWKADPFWPSIHPCPIELVELVIQTELGRPRLDPCPVAPLNNDPYPTCLWSKTNPHPTSPADDPVITGPSCDPTQLSPDPFVTQPSYHPTHYHRIQLPADPTKPDPNSFRPNRTRPKTILTQPFLT